MTEKKTGSIEHILVHFRWLEPWHGFCIHPSKNFWHTTFNLHFSPGL